jgi:hypothetical protein
MTRSVSAKARLRGAHLSTPAEQNKVLEIPLVPAEGSRLWRQTNLKPGAPIARSGLLAAIADCHRDSALITPDADFRSCQRFRQGILWLMAKRAVTSRHYLAEVWRSPSN